MATQASSVPSADGCVLREAVREGLKILRDGATLPAMEAWASFAEAALAHEPEPEPFGHYWQEQHAKSGEVVRDGFVRGSSPPRWGSVTPGFEFVFTPLFSSDGSAKR